MINRYFYKSSLSDFVVDSIETTFGKISRNDEGDTVKEQKYAWSEEIEIMQKVLLPWQGENGDIIFEYSIPRLGKRIDVVVLLRGIVFVIEFKAGKQEYLQNDMEQVMDYALDLKNFHLDSHHRTRLQPDIESWFLADKMDVRSSLFLEDAATEFDIQGLELDWTCLVWDGDFRYTPNGWDHNAFRGSKWQKIRQPEAQSYQLNAYRVLMTRARQGMIICVPEGNVNDHTRQPSFYDGTYDYLKSLGLEDMDLDDSIIEKC